MAINKVDMIESVHNFIDAANLNQKRVSDDIESMKSRMEIFE